MGKVLMEKARRDESNQARRHGGTKARRGGRCAAWWWRIRSRQWAVGGGQRRVEQNPNLKFQISDKRTKGEGEKGNVDDTGVGEWRDRMLIAGMMSWRPSF